MLPLLCVRVCVMLSSGWYGNCIAYYLVALLSIPLELVHLQSLPSPFTGALEFVPVSAEFPCVTELCALLAGCLISSLRAHVRKTVNFERARQLLTMWAWFMFVRM